MAGYTKLFNSILASTVWSEPVETRVLWITLLAMADKNGVAEGSVPGLAVFARLPVEAVRTALERLSSPDPDSRSKEHAGRRIEAVEGGWRILNHGKYRAKLGADERREYNRIKQAQFRKRKRQQMSLTVNHSKQNNHKAEADTDPDTKAKKEKSVSVSPAFGINGTTDPELAARAGKFLTLYAELYPKHRKGARYHARPALDFPKAVELCQTWPDDRLEKLAIIFLKTDHEFAESGSRTIGQFAALASWCDGRLSEVEATRS